MLTTVAVYVLSALLLAVAAAPRGRAASAAVLRRRARKLVVALGPAFVKGAQLLSTRRDVLPGPWCAALGLLHDQVPPMSSRAARAAVRKAYGRYPPLRVDWTAVASGSIACVYRATLPHGRVVAVKIRRRGVRRVIELDFALARGFARLLQRLPGFRGFPAVTVLDQIGAAVRRQADFTVEFESLRALGDTLRDLTFLHIPAPIDSACADGVLVMEFVDGLESLDPAALTPAQRADLVRKVLRCVYRMLFLDGLVHCDMHPGNLYLGRDGRIVLLDAGFVVRLPPTVRRLFAEFFLNLAQGNGPHCADVVRRSAREVSPNADLAGFRAGLIELVERSTGRSAAEFSLVRFAGSLFGLQRRHGLFAAPEFVFPLLALLVIEGRINDFDASVDFQAEAIPVLADAVLSGVLLIAAD
ncbi:ABC1 kinase family protein [Actinokineospora sp.]|uniref:ABC1 kinase family protein n=1 Tax=Actinokineospora sp. TaxID=1872133 RepID=UPI004037B3FE